MQLTSREAFSLLCKALQTGEGRACGPFTIILKRVVCCPNVMDVTSLLRWVVWSLRQNPFHILTTTHKFTSCMGCVVFNCVTLVVVKP